MAKKKTTDLANLDSLCLLEQADKGSSEALVLLQEHYNTKPDTFPCANLPSTIINARLEQAGLPVGTRLAIQNSIDRIFKRVAGSNPSQLERLLAGRIVACWLDVQLTELGWASARNVSLQQGDYHSRKLTRAHNRYLSAITALARVRKLALPTIQLNIAEKQINNVGDIVANEISSMSP